MIFERARDRDSPLLEGTHKVQVDFTEGRLAIKIDPSGNLLQSFIDLNNLALARFSTEDRKRIGVHTCPGADAVTDYGQEEDRRRSLDAGFDYHLVKPLNFAELKNKISELRAVPEKPRRFLTRAKTH